MERNILHQTELYFCTTQTEDVLLKLKIVWSVDTTHVLVAVNSQNGQLQKMFLWEKCDVKELNWRDFSKYITYGVQIYGLKLDTTTGLKLDTTTGLERRKRHGISLYSVEAVKKYIIHPSPILSPLAQTNPIMADLRMTYGTDRMMNSLGQQTEFDIEAYHEPPMGYSLHHRLPSGYTAGLYIIYNEKTKKEYLMVSLIASRSFIFSRESIPLLPIQDSRTVYKVCSVTLKDTENCKFGSIHVACGKSKVLTIKTCNSKEDLQELMTKAQAYCRSHTRYPRTYNIQQFYRNKPQRYFLDILANRGGIMTKYIKDNNGDPYSPINNKIDGLFFSASLDTRYMKPPPFSYFGDTRLFIPAQELITPGTRMYFSDFFCHRQVHYVTVVLTKRGSLEDRFCDGRLLELDLKDNPFFTVQEEISNHYSHVFYPSLRQQANQKTFKMVSVNKFHVEFLYTENLDIRDREFRIVEGRGESKKNGIPKNASCRICNLDLPSYRSSMFY